VGYVATVGNANVDITADDSQARKEVGGFTGFLKRTGDIAMGVAGGLAVFEGLKNTFATLRDSTLGANASMEQYESTLSVVLGSQQKAVEMLAWAEKFAATTPFEIPDIVEATTRLESYGLKAQEVMGVTGDMAAVMGKPLMQAVEAVADAQTGELERLKEFGITKKQIVAQANKMFDEEVVNASGQITNQKKFNEALFALMEERYQGGMALQSKTFNGMISNVKDAMGTMGRELSRPMFEKLKSGLKSVVPVMTAVTQAIKGDWVGVRQTLEAAFGPELALKIENLFLGIGAWVNEAKQFMVSLLPAIKNIGTFLWNLRPAAAVVGTIIVGAFKVLATVLPPILNGLTGIAAKFSEWSGFAPLVAGLTAAFITLKVVNSVAAGIGLLRAGLALMMNPLSRAILFTQAWTKAQAFLNATLLANPIGLVIAVLVGLGVALVVAYKKSETFRNIVNSAWQSLKDGFAATINWFTTTLPAWVQNVVSWFMNMKNQVTANIQSFYASARSLFNQLFNSVRASVISFALSFVQTWVNLKSRVVSLASQLFNTVMNLLRPFITFFINSWNNLKLMVLSIVALFLNILIGDFSGMKIAVLGIVTALKNQAVNIFNLFKNTVVRLILFLANGIRNGFTNAKNWSISAIKALYNGAVSLFRSLLSRALSYISSTARGILNGFTNAKNWAISSIKSLYNGAISLFRSLYIRAISYVSSTARGILNGFNNAKNWAVSAIRNLYNSVTSWLGRIPSKVTNMKNDMLSILRRINLYSIGKDIIQGLVNGIGSMATSVKNKVKDVTSGITKKVASLLKLGSPSRLFYDYGRWTFEGFVNGADKMIGDMQKVAGRAVEAVKPNFQPINMGSLLRKPKEIVSSLKMNLNSYADKFRPEAAEVPAGGPFVIQSILNGRVIAEETYRDIDELRQREDTTNKRARGEWY
jgi:phage-related protein